jgi:hypothetical protein
MSRRSILAPSSAEFLRIRRSEPILVRIWAGERLRHSRQLQECDPLLGRIALLTIQRYGRDTAELNKLDLDDPTHILGEEDEETLALY